MTVDMAKDMTYVNIFLLTLKGIGRTRNMKSVISATRSRKT